MNAARIIRGANADGVRFRITPTGNLQAIGEAPIVDKWVPQIQAHKIELIELVREWGKLLTAINAYCADRCDTDDHRTALQADCLREHPSDWGWWVHYFEREWKS